MAEAREVPDVFADQFHFRSGPYGTALNFLATAPGAPALGAAPQTELKATVRMSVEHAKVVAFLIRRQILQQERETGVRYDVPPRILNGLGVSPEDWEAFWS
jgi:hypothetical protein